MLITRVATLSALVAFFSVVAVGTAWLLLPGPEAASGPAPAAGSDTLPPDGPEDSDGPAAASGTVSLSAGVRARVVERPAQVLAGWDERRAAAWARGDVDALRALYVEGSRTGRRDVRMLREWNDRGARVGRMSTEVRDLRVRRRAPDAMVLLVTDRLVAPTAELGGGATVPLPDDGWSTRLVELRRGTSGWQVAEVRESALG